MSSSKGRIVPGQYVADGGQKPIVMTKKQFWKKLSLKGGGKGGQTAQWRHFRITPEFLADRAVADARKRAAKLEARRVDRALAESAANDAALMAQLEAEAK